MKYFAALALLLVLSGLSACFRDSKTALNGSLLFQDRPLAAAQVEIYLKQGKDRATLPFATTGTDSEGRWHIELPAGRYYIIGKKKVDGEDGHTRMLMAESPANPVELKEGVLAIPAFNLREMGRDGGLVAEPGTGVSGRVVQNNTPVANAYVYVYTEKSADLIGPSYGEAVRTAADGTFSINLPAGKFYLAARKRADGGRSGDVAPGDLNGQWPGNPILIERGRFIALGDFILHPVSTSARQDRFDQGKFARTDTAFTGRIVDQDGNGVKGVYVFAYLDSRMVGKPTYISAPTGPDGRFELRLSDGGSYYIGARSSYGGPLEPGEWVGTYDGRPDHMARADKGQNIDLKTIIVREVW